MERDDGIGPDGKKTCKECGDRKTLVNFQHTRSGSHSDSCKECRATKWRQTMADKREAQKAAVEASKHQAFFAPGNWETESPNGQAAPHVHHWLCGDETIKKDLPQFFDTHEPAPLEKVWHVCIRCGATKLEPFVSPIVQRMERARFPVDLGDAGDQADEAADLIGEEELEVMVNPPSVMKVVVRDGAMRAWQTVEAGADAGSVVVTSEAYEEGTAPGGFDIEAWRDEAARPPEPEPEIPVGLGILLTERARKLSEREALSTRIEEARALLASFERRLVVLGLEASNLDLRIENFELRQEIERLKARSEGTEAA